MIYYDILISHNIVHYTEAQQELLGLLQQATPPVNGVLGAKQRGGGSEKGEVLLRGASTLRYFAILGENSARQVPICAAAA